MTVTVNLPNELEQKFSAIPKDKREVIFIDSVKSSLNYWQYQEHNKKTQTPEVLEILKNAKKEAKELKKQGRTREHAKNEFIEICEDIGNDLKENNA